METTMVTAQVPAEMVEALRARAQTSDRSLSGELRCALREYLGDPQNDERRPVTGAARESSPEDSRRRDEV